MTRNEKIDWLKSITSGRLKVDPLLGKHVYTLEFGEMYKDGMQFLIDSIAVSNEIFNEKVRFDKGEVHVIVCGVEIDRE